MCRGDIYNLFFFSSLTRVCIDLMPYLCNIDAHGKLSFTRLNCVLICSASCLYSLFFYLMRLESDTEPSWLCFYFLCCWIQRSGDIDGFVLSFPRQSLCFTAIKDITEKLNLLICFWFMWFIVFHHRREFCLWDLNCYLMSVCRRFLCFCFSVCSPASLPLSVWLSV